jgi:hypothetical protein
VLRVRIGLAVLVTALLVQPSWAEDDKEGAPPLRVDNCEAAPAESEETPEQEEARRIKLAGDNYDRGLVLYEEGDYKGAVDAFVASYCSKAHPSAFYNIAQSYERLLDFERSVQYFERYVNDAGPEAANSKRAALRAEVLRNLPAQLRIATVPAGANISIRNQAGITARGTANADSPIEVRQGRYTMRVEMPGYEPREEDLVTKPGQPYSYYLTLEPQKAPLRITAAPSNARIFIDKRLVGVGSYAASMPLGNYEVTVEAPKRETTTRRIQVTTGKANTQSIELLSPPASGRPAMLIASSVGLGLAGGFAVNGILRQDTSITGIGALTTTAVGFGGAYYGIPESLSQGDAWYIIEASLIGFIEGLIVGQFFNCERVELPGGEREEECKDRTVAGSALTGGLLGAATATLTRKSFRLSTGDTALLGSGAFWGLASGALFYSIFDSDTRLRDPMLFSGLNLGLVSAAGLIANDSVSLRRIAIIDLAGLGGLIGGASVAQAFDSGDEKLAHFSMLGMVGGLVVGTFTTRFMDDESLPADLKPDIGATRDVDGKTVMKLGLSSTF